MVSVGNAVPHYYVPSPLYIHHTVDIIVIRQIECICPFATPVLYIILNIVCDRGQGRPERNDEKPRKAADGYTPVVEPEGGNRPGQDLPRQRWIITSPIMISWITSSSIPEQEL